MNHRTTRTPTSSVGLSVALALAVGGCGGGGGGSIDGPDDADLGTIQVTVQTSAATAGAALDSDGYIVVVEGLGTRPVEANGELTFTNVPPGEHRVELRELQANCTTPSNPVAAAVVARGTTAVTFQVTCWEPTSGRIVFTSDRSAGSNIWSMNPDGTDLVQLTTLGHSFWPVWSPDGWKIAFTLGGGLEQIHVMNADGSGLTRLTSSYHHEEAPAWSPDGTRVAFARYTLTWGPEDIYVVDADGSGNEVQLTSHPARDFLPAWSPDGSRIAFTTDRDGNEEVYVMNADGSDPVNLTRHPASDVVWAGAWSPDGTRLVFQTGRMGNAEIFVMNADGSDPVNLTNSPLQEKGGAWSPDGSQVVFWQDPAGDVFIVYADGTGMADITNSVSLDRYPHWSRGAGVDDSEVLRAPWDGLPGGR